MEPFTCSTNLVGKILMGVYTSEVYSTLLLPQSFIIKSLDEYCSSTLRTTPNECYVIVRRYTMSPLIYAIKLEY